MRKLRATFLYIQSIVVASLLAGPALRAEPPNLGEAKVAVSKYIDSGEYIAEVGKVCAEASKFLQERARRAPGRLAVVFDLDETIFSNLEEMRSLDFGYNKDIWDRWIHDGRAAPLPPVVDLYKQARALGFEVILLSGRTESSREGTARNLNAIGVDDYKTLVLMPADWKGTTELFKTQARARLTREGYIIVANIGDQPGDLTGGYSEKIYKIPDPFYLVK